MIARYASALGAGTLITFALLFVMQALIHLQPGAVMDTRDRGELMWLKRVVEERPVRQRQEPIDPEVLKNAPVEPGRPDTAFSGEGLRVTTQPTGPGPITTTLTGISQPDGPLINIVRVEPAYPAVAAARELEGWVDVRFDVTTDGRVVNAIVIGSSHRVFERAAIAAALRFRFRAPVVNGIPQVASGIEYRFRFRMPE